MDETTPAGNEPLWLHEGESRNPRRPKASRARRMGTAAAVAACLAVVGVPVGLVLSSGTVPTTASAPPQHPHHAHEGPAARKLISALGATVDSGSFQVAYSLSETSTCSTTTTATAKPSTSGCASTPGLNEPIVGTGVIDTDPFAMVATSTVKSLGKVTIYDNGTDVWEHGGGDYGLSSTAGGGPGQPLSGFATLVESTLGKRLGAMAMQGMSSPTGYLDLQQQEVVGATAAGTGTVDGTAVTVFQFWVGNNYSPTAAALTSEEAKAITAAGQLERSEGYLGATVQVSVDPTGFIRRTMTKIKFSDGDVTTITATFSDFGCAGTVAMPGTSGGATAPAGCVSPDTGLPPSTTTTTTTASATGAANAATSPTTGSTSTTSPTSSGSTTTTVAPTASTLAPTTTVPTGDTPPPTTTVPGGG